MDDRNQEVFRRYDIRVYTTYKARGAVVLETDKGLLLLKNFEGSTARVEFENAVKEFIMQNGYPNVDLYLRNMDQELVTEDFMGNKYVLKNWFIGEECNLKEHDDVVDATENLAAMHSLMIGMPLVDEIKNENLQPNLFDTFEKRNRELKRVRTYIKDKRQKNEFEMCYLSNYEKFYKQGLQALEYLRNSDYLMLYQEAIRETKICHGNYTYHNVMMLRGNQPASAYEVRNKNRLHLNNESEGELMAAELCGQIETAAVTNFDKASIGVQIFDLYNFLRKVMEKNDWDVEYGCELIEKYRKVRPISSTELQVLYVLLLYPEKFWKITNFYYNSKKSWVPARNIQKLFSIEQQYEAKEKFLNTIKEMLAI